MDQTEALELELALRRELLRCVPAQAKRILYVGSGGAEVGRLLRAGHPERQLFAIAVSTPSAIDRIRVQADRDASDGAAAVDAVSPFERVFQLDLAREDPDLEKESIDCILYDEVLEQMVAPEQVLLRHRTLFSPSGVMVVTVTNVQHHSVIQDLLKNDFQYTVGGVLDSTHLRLFSYASLAKLFLDVGYVPRVVHSIEVPPPPGLIKAMRPLMDYLGLSAERMSGYLNAYQYVVAGMPLRFAAGTQAIEPMTFVTCVENEDRLEANLLSSPCLGPGSPHELIVVSDVSSAATGFNLGIERAQHRLVVCVHQDVYLPHWWPAQFEAQYRAAERLFGTLGPVGIYGARSIEGQSVRVGHMIDGDLAWQPTSLPAKVDTLDEILIAVRKDSPLRFDPTLGFHLYGADLCVAARQAGLPSVVVDALCLHNSVSFGKNPTLAESAGVFHRKWGAAANPPATPAAVDVRDGSMTPRR